MVGMHMNKGAGAPRLKVFVPLTNLCRDYCGYCTFRRDPGQPIADVLGSVRAHQFAHGVADFRMMVGAPVQRCVNVAAIDGVIGRRLRFADDDQACARRTEKGCRQSRCIQ